MSRFRRVIYSVASGYMVLCATAIYALASVPLALHYLSKERFALWALMTSISGYLSLIDFGMSSSVARLLIDHKDKKASGAYGGMTKTGWLVLVIQGGIIGFAGFTLAPGLADLLKIDAALRTEFVLLLRWQSAVLAFGFAVRIFSHLLYAHQRLHVINYSQMGMLALSFALLWFFFGRGHGVFSLVWANIIAALVGAGIMFVSCWKLRLFPPPGAWGRARWKYFRELFNYGKDVFLVAVGTQLIMASQTMIITRVLGLQAAAVWAIGTRVFHLVSQLVWRIADVSAPAFSEMLVRGERQILRERYKAVLVVTASLSGAAAGAYVLCNSLFVTVWTNHKVFWPAPNDILLGVWMIATAILHCHNGFVLLTKQIGFMRYVYFLEGIVFVSLALLTARWAGMAAIITSSILCSALFSGAYGVWRVSRFFNIHMREVGLDWLVPLGRVLLISIPLGCATWWAFHGIESPLVRLAVHVLVGGSVGGYVFLRYGLPTAFQSELLRRAPRRFNPVLRRVFATASGSL